MNTKDVSHKQEIRVANLLNGKVVKASGGTQFLAGDVVANDYLVECKTTAVESGSMVVKKDWIKKAQEQAFETGYNSFAVAISFGDDEDYFIVDKHDMEFLVRAVYTNGGELH